MSATGLAAAPAAAQTVDLNDALKTAVLDQDALSVVSLLNQGASPNARWDGTPVLALAADRPSTIILRLLLEAGAEVNAASPEGDTALMYACHRSPRCAWILLARGARPEGRGTLGKTALHWASWSRSIDLVQELLRIGADPCARDENGRTAREKIAGQVMVSIPARIPGKHIPRGCTVESFADQWPDREIISILQVAEAARLRSKERLVAGR